MPSSRSSLVDEVVEWGADTQREAHDKLEKWAKYLKPFPACWKKVQPFLCAMYLPPCANGTVQVSVSKYAPLRIFFNKFVYTTYARRLVCPPRKSGTNGRTHPIILVFRRPSGSECQTTPVDFVVVNLTAKIRL